MTPQEACVQAFENGRKKGDAEGYARGKAEAFAEAGDLISRKALLNEMTSVFGTDGDNLISPIDAKILVEDAPAVAAQTVKRGRWVSLEPEIGLFACSECDHRILRAECNYCPNCGADMRGGNDG